MAENTIPIAQLARLSGLCDRRLRELASEGWIPKVEGGNYPLVPTIQGLLRYYREREQFRVVQDAYDSIGGCASAIGIPVSTIKHAKRQGCSAFRGKSGLSGATPSVAVRISGSFAGQLRPGASAACGLQNAKLNVELRQLRHELIRSRK